MVGNVVDLRGTAEGQQRFEAVRGQIPLTCVRLAQEELGL